MKQQIWVNKKSQVATIQAALLAKGVESVVIQANNQWCIQAI